jgi:hypothetical protein
MPKDDSFYEDHTNRLQVWASWERANALDFYDSEEEERHEQELQAMRDHDSRERWARWELEKERMRRWQLLHPPKPPPSSDEEDDITFEELEDAVTQLDSLDSTGTINWNSLTARTREPQRSHAALRHLSLTTQTRRLGPRWKNRYEGIGHIWRRLRAGVWATHLLSLLTSAQCLHAKPNGLRWQTRLGMRRKSSRQAADRNQSTAGSRHRDQN